MSEHGRLGTAARRWAKQREESLIIDSQVSVLIQLAIDAADMADRARDDGEDRLYLAAASRLQQLMRAAIYDDGSGGTGFGSGDPWAAEMARIMGSTPGMGNTTES